MAVKADFPIVFRLELSAEANTYFQRYCGVPSERIVKSFGAVETEKTVLSHCINCDVFRQFP